MCIFSDLISGINSWLYLRCSVSSNTNPMPNQDIHLAKINMDIPADLIQSIVSYVPLEHLRVLSKASPIFDQEICRQGIRVVYCRDKCRRIHETDIVIRCDDWEIIVITDGKYYQRDKYQTPYIVHHRKIYASKEIVKSDKLLVDFKNCIIISVIYGDGGVASYAITRVAEITSSINRGVYATMSDCVMVPLNFDSVTSIKTYDFLAGDPKIIDLESQYIANNDGYFSFIRFSYVFLNGKWVKT